MSNSIHPTAIVSDSVNLGDNISIGAYACVEGNITIGDNCTIQHHAIITGKVSLGSDNLIGYNAIVGSDPQDLNYTESLNTSVEIGSNNTIRENSTIHRAATQDGVTHIGDSNFLMAGAHVAHDCQLGNHIIIANNALLAGHVHIGDRAFLGGGSVFHQFVHVGPLAMVQGLGGMGKNVPPYLIVHEVNNVSGINAIGLKRAGFSLEDRTEVKRAYKLIYNSGLNLSQALEEADSGDWNAPAKAFFDFIRNAGKRGIVSPY